MLRAGYGAVRNLCTVKIYDMKIVTIDSSLYCNTNLQFDL
jgi:hypothetical protein